MLKYHKLIFILILFLAVPSIAGELFPQKGWSDKPNPLASTEAVLGGEISIFAGQYPKSLNYYLDNNVLSAEIFGAMYETLLTVNPVTLDYEPGLAEKWLISDDKKSFTFYMDKRAKWSDGKPVTAHDVKWTYDTIMDPKNLTGSHKLDMERFQPLVVIDKHTIRFTAKTVHWKNLSVAGGFHILCRHAFEGKDFNRVNFEFPVVSGLYILGKMDEGLYISLERRSNWWNKKARRFRGTGNFQTIIFKFFAERENAFEAFKKGMIDLFPIYTARIWINETKGEDFANNRIIKQKIYNYHPVGFQGFAMNMRKPPFDDVRVRKAMAFLLDRRKMNSALMYSQYFLHRSYFEDLYTKENPCPNMLVPFDKEKAGNLLRQAGWEVNSKTGFLEKNGKRFSFRFLSRNSSSEKFLAIFAEDLKDIGIELVIDKKDWAAWARDMDEYNYQMTWAAWGFGVFKDPESMWLSKEADRKGGNNITGFKNLEVDNLIEKQKEIFDVNERNKIYRKIDQIVYNAAPYVLLWNINYTRLLYWNKFGTPDIVLSKYGSESSANTYWWLDEDSRDDLYDAMKNKLYLPPKNSSVYFDEMF
ncbi:MAG: ABC transporter substrate-binding protein [Deltaproteobacteria bacterium]|nr:ABC transporter substrate-binding protein [Deltaproteobacteria bacterium]